MHDLQTYFARPVEVKGNLIIDSSFRAPAESQTKDAFSDKWTHVDTLTDREPYHRHAKDWFLSLFGFENEDDLAAFLADKKVIFDAGCGLGFKAAWLARLAPNSIVIGADISAALPLSARSFLDVPNLYFVQADIADSGLKAASVDFVVCDQVLMHTDEPETTFAELTRLTAPEGTFACYVYAKKALPRELVDDYFRHWTYQVSSDEMWQFSEQLTELGKRLSDLKVSFECPEIPLLGIKGGQYDIQRFIYWNFLKCFWNEDWGFEMSKVTNFDWYAPSNAKRYSQAEFEQMILDNRLSVAYFHKEEACYSGRFIKNDAAGASS